MNLTLSIINNFYSYFSSEYLLNFLFFLFLSLFQGFELTSNKFPAFTQVDFTPHYKQNYPVKYLYGFSHNGFSYFITIQPISIITSTYETRLARVCQNDMQFFSYMEVPLECKGDNGITYSIATSAYFGEIGKAKLNSLGATEGNLLLFLKFTHYH